MNKINLYQDKLSIKFKISYPKGERDKFILKIQEKKLCDLFSKNLANTMENTFVRDAFHILSFRAISWLTNATLMDKPKSLNSSKI